MKEFMGETGKMSEWI